LYFLESSWFALSDGIKTAQFGWMVEEELRLKV
jgi:hypothetical protein